MCPEEFPGDALGKGFLFIAWHGAPCIGFHFPGSDVRSVAQKSDRIEQFILSGPECSHPGSMNRNMEMDPPAAPIAR